MNFHGGQDEKQMFSGKSSVLRHSGVIADTPPEKYSGNFQ